MGDDALNRDSLARLRAEIWREPADDRAIRERLLRLTGDLREQLVDARHLSAEWEKLGIEVRQAPMPVRGICSPELDSRVVYVNEDDHYELQRFTVAHEVGHMLLATEDRRQRPLSPRREEILCEEFASRLLIDRNALAEKLADRASPPDPEDLLRFCGHFRVNVRPMLIAVGELLADTPYRLLLSRRRGHWRRPREVAFRVEGTAGSRYAYFPRSQRLISLGLSTLASRADESSHGALLTGVDHCVSIGLRGLSGERTSATSHGPVRWRAIRQGDRNPFLLAVLDLGDAGRLDR